MKNLLLEINEDYEMARLSQGKCCLLCGNFWDFHSGCYGSEITFEDGSSYDFKKEWTDNIRRPHAVARMICEKFGLTYKVKNTKKFL